MYSAIRPCVGNRLCVWGGHRSCVASAMGVGESGKPWVENPPGFLPRRKLWLNDHVAQLYCRVQPWSAVLTRTPPNQALESPLSPAPWEAGRAPTPWAGTPFMYDCALKHHQPYP